MSYVVVRGEKVPIEPGRPVDVVIPEWNILVKETVLGEGVVLWANVNVYGARIGDQVRLASFVDIHRDVRIGARSKVQSFTAIGSGTTLGTGVFVGPHVAFTNDRYPEACEPDGTPREAFELYETRVGDGASIGGGCVILGGVTIGERARIGAGSVVAEDVPPGETWFGEKARRHRGPPA